MNEEWGNIELPGLSDEELLTKNWTKVAANKEAAKREDVKLHNAEGQVKRSQTDWSNKMLGNKNGLGSRSRRGLTNSIESNQRRSQALIGIVRDNLRGVPKPKLICPHCGKEGGKPQMIQFHFDKCKHK